MIKSFSDKDLGHCWMFEKCEKIKQDLVSRALRKLDIIDAATCINDIYLAPGCFAHMLTGKRHGEFAVKVNGPWRIVFRFEDGDAYDVGIEQYH